MIAVITAQGEIEMTEVAVTAANLQGTDAAQEPAPAKEAPCWRTRAARLAVQGKPRKRAARAKKAHRGASSAKLRQERHIRPPRQQNRQGRSTAEAPWRRNWAGSDEGDRLAGSLGAGVYLRRA